MNGSQLRHTLESILRRIGAGITTIKTDCATKGKSSYRQELVLLTEEADFHVLVLALCGAINMCRAVSDGGDYRTEQKSETLVVYYVATVRVTAEYHPELGETHFVFTDRGDEAATAKRVATAHISRIMGLGEFPAT